MPRLLSAAGLAVLLLASCMRPDSTTTPDPSPSPNPGQTPTLQCRVEPSSPLTAGGPVEIRLVLTNPTREPLWFLKWNTPFEGWRGSIFTVIDPRGVEVPYGGPLMKRSDPSRDEYEQIPPGGTVEAAADLSNVYDLRTPGRYTLRVTDGLVDLTADAASVPRTREQHQPAPLQCEEVVLPLTP